MKHLTVLFILLCTAQAYSQNELRHFNKYQNRFKIGTDIGRGNPFFNYECLVGKGASIEFGFGLTFDDRYAIQNWEGHQYIKRNNFSNTRYSWSFGVNFLPVPNVSFLYMGVEGKFRKYYNADIDFFHSSNGMFLGAKRNEATIKLKLGNFFRFNRFLLDYSAGIGYMSSNDEWAYFAQPNHVNYTKDEGTVQKLVFSFEVKIGISGKKLYVEK